jgi:hypothetical protein
MSHKTEIKTELNNKNYLLKALDKLGFTYEVAKDNSKLKTKSQYEGDIEVDILITGNVSGVTSRYGYGSGYQSDVGFVQQEDGTFTAVGDFYNMVDKDGKHVSMEGLKCNVTTYSKEVEVNERLQAFMFQMEENTRKEDSKELSFTMQRWVS